MACLGVHFAIHPQQAERLLAANDDEELVAIVQEEIESAWWVGVPNGLGVAAGFP
jgi:hypothetical protein